MSEVNELEVYRQLNASQDKYTYFMLAAAGSAIAYALSRAQDEFKRDFCTLGISLLLWGVSFSCGCFIGCMSFNYLRNNT